MTDEWLLASFDDDNWPIDYNHLKKIQDSDLGYVISDLHIKKIVQGQKLLELIEKKIRKLEKRAEEHHGVGKWYLNEWKKILEGSKK